MSDRLQADAVSYFLVLSSVQRELSALHYTWQAFVPYMSGKSHDGMTFPLEPITLSTLHISQA